MFVRSHVNATPFRNKPAPPCTCTTFRWNLKRRKNQVNIRTKWEWKEHTMANSPPLWTTLVFCAPWSPEVTSRVITHTPRSSVYAPYENFLFATVSLSDIRFSHSVNKLHFLVPRHSTATAMIKARWVTDAPVYYLYSVYKDSKHSSPSKRRFVQTGLYLKIHTWICFWHRKATILRDKSSPKAKTIVPFHGPVYFIKKKWMTMCLENACEA